MSDVQNNDKFVQFMKTYSVDNLKKLVIEPTEIIVKNAPPSPHEEIQYYTEIYSLSTLNKRNKLILNKAIECNCEKKEDFVRLVNMIERNVTNLEGILISYHQKVEAECDKIDTSVIKKFLENYNFCLKLENIQLSYKDPTVDLIYGKFVRSAMNGLVQCIKFKNKYDSCFFENECEKKIQAISMLIEMLVKHKLPEKKELYIGKTSLKHLLKVIKLCAKIKK